MRRFNVGDYVRIDIPDESDPNHNRLHGEHGEVADIIRDDAGEETGDSRDSAICRLQLDDGKQEVDLRWRDLRPPMNELIPTSGSKQSRIVVFDLRSLG